MLTLALVAFLGLTVALASVFLGLGGGVVLVPLLPTFFDLSAHSAIATSVCTIFLVVVTNTWRFQKNFWVRWTVVRLMGPIAAVSAFMAALVSVWISELVLRVLLLAILILVTVRTMLFSLGRPHYELAPMHLKRHLALLFSGSLAGVTSGLVGVGAGVILSPMMILLRVVKPEELTPTANANMMFTTGAASLGFLVSGSWQGHWQWGLVRLDLVLGIYLVACLLSSLFRPWQNRLPFQVKSLLLSLLLLALIVKVSVQSFIHS